MDDEENISELEQKLLKYPTIRNLMQNYSSYTIEDIKTKILGIQKRALEIYPFSYIKRFDFLTPRATLHPNYQKIIENHKDKKILDIGCGLGTDVRQFIFDGIRKDKITGLELNKEFITLGFELFEDKTNLSNNFIIGNILDEKIPKLHERGPFDIIFTGSVIHLLRRKQIEKFLKIVYNMLPESGIFFGRTSTLQKPAKLKKSQSHIRYLHSPDTLKSTFEKLHFKNTQINISARFIDTLTNQSEGYVVSFTGSK